jgi:DNA-binding NarL/FixJ family response regulator
MKTVMIVEDSELQRQSLELSLSSRGFEVFSAGQVGEARRLIEEMSPETIDVLVLDMRLDGPEERDTTGADIGIEVRSRWPRYPPEFLVYSVFQKVNYYKLALGLGAAAYLSKEETTQDDVIRHVRALALRRALSIERPGAAIQISSTADTSRDRSEAIKRFCKEVLTPELASCLGAPFAILLTDEKGTQCCTNNRDIPEGHLPLYSVLQALAQGQTNYSEPFVVNIKMVSEPMSGFELEVLRHFEGAALLPLSDFDDVRISMAVLKGKDQSQYAEDPLALTRVLAQHLRPAVLEYLVSLISALTDINSRRNAVLSATAQLCLFVGQEQQTILSDLAGSQGMSDRDRSLQSLDALADDLRQTGEILIGMVGGKTEHSIGRVGGENAQKFYMAEIIRLAAGEVRGRLPEDSVRINGDFEMRAAPEMLMLAASRLLQWFASRAIENTYGAAPTITVKCATTDEGLEVTFEDRSRRLNGILRQRMFSPFTEVLPAPRTSGKIAGPGLHLPLYLAKTLIEFNYRGVLEDRSDELEGEFGHRFVMRFPSSEPPEVGLGA